MRRRRYILPRVRPGTAMTEFTLALPLLVTVLALIWLLGFLHVRKQQVVVASRHTVWRSFDGGAPDNATLNREALDNKANSVGQDHRDGLLDALEGWTDAAADEDRSAGVLADELIMRHFSHDGQVNVEAWYDPPLAVGETFGDDVSFDHGRAGREWLYGAESEWAALRGLYYADLDDILASYSGPGEDLARRIRGLFSWNW